MWLLPEWLAMVLVAIGLSGSKTADCTENLALLEQLTFGLWQTIFAIVVY